MNLGRKPQSLVGQIFGRLRVDSIHGRLPSGKAFKWFWSCTCICGAKSIVSTGALKSGQTKSCGCLKKDNIRKRITTKKCCSYCNTEFIPTNISVKYCSPMCYFMGNIAKTDNCWNWIGTLRKDGYGVLRKNKKEILAHRFSWELHNKNLSPDIRASAKFANTQRISDRFSLSQRM